MSRNLIVIAAALSLAAVLPACQSTGSSEPGKPKPGICEKAKTDGARNTPLGQAKIKFHCNPNMSANDFGRELARQGKCFDETGKACET